MKVAVLGHREIGTKDFVVKAAREQIIKLIEEGADTFCFAYYGGFITKCYELIGELKEEYGIKRVLVRPEYTSERRAVVSYILSIMEQGFDDSICYKDLSDQKIIYKMIDECDVLLTFYFECHVTGCRWGISEDVELPPAEKRSATARAVFYAKRKKKRIINVFELLEV